MRAICRTAFDNGITQFDLANNYGPEYGRAEINAGHILEEDFKPYRDELVILIEESRPSQILDNIKAVDRTDFTEAELQEIDRISK